MKSEKGLNLKILDITMTIQEKYPELYKYLDEMLVTIPNMKNPKINVNTLSLYYDSLTSLLENYVQQHEPESIK
ncbi:MAG TPA: hypothetical protein VMV32_07585 [Ignavibacteriaceae bacterium]|nr:hypothetical protein [Ignavibacteriaceae bacterium]